MRLWRYKYRSWRRNQMKTHSKLLAICARNSTVTGEFPVQRPVTWSFDVFFELRLNKRLSKQSWGWWFETPSRPLWRHCNDTRNALERLNAASNSGHVEYDLQWSYKMLALQVRNFDKVRFDKLANSEIGVKEKCSYGNHLLEIGFRFNVYNHIASRSGFKS